MKARYLTLPAVALDKLTRLGWVGPESWVSIETADKEVNTVGGFDGDSTVTDRNRLLSFVGNTTAKHLVLEACLIGGLEQPRTEGPMNLDCSADHRIGDLVDVHSVPSVFSVVKQLEVAAATEREESPDAPGA